MALRTVEDMPLAAVEPDSGAELAVTLPTDPLGFGFFRHHHFSTRSRFPSTRSLTLPLSLLNVLRARMGGSFITITI